jgi:hypothetical protein
VSKRSLLVLLLAAPALASEDYRADSRAWNGLSELIGEAERAGCSVRAPDTLDWSTIGVHDVLWFVYPQVPVDGGRLRRHLSAGGRALVADDFGAATDALATLEIHRRKGPLGDVPRYRENPELPIAHPELQSELGRAAGEIVANHPAWFETALPATYAFSPRAALVVEGQVGTGWFVALADPSVLINNMLELDGNRAFARALVRRSCTAGDRVLLFTQRFATRGELAGDEGSPFQRFNQMLAGINGLVKDGGGDPRALGAAALLFAVAALVVLAGTFPTRAPIDQHWTRLRALLDEHVDTPWAQRGLPWDWALPATLLRDEALERVSAALGTAADRLGPRELGRRVSEKFGDDAGRAAHELWRHLHGLGWRTGEPPAERISRRRLERMHALATQLFDAIGR